MGLLLSSPFFGAHVFFNLLVPFLGSTESRFFVPTCHGSMTPRANAVKDGRRAGGSTSSAVARPRLDGGEHGVTLRWSGPRHTHSFFNLSVRESLCSGSVDKPWFKARQSEASLPSWRAGSTRTTTLYSVDPRGIRTMMQSYASVARLREAGPFSPAARGPWVGAGHRHLGSSWHWAPDGADQRQTCDGS